MKKILPALLLLVCFYACNDDSRKPPKSENDVDAARNFIGAALAGDYRLARTYMLPDSINQERMNLIERVSLSPDERKGLAEASINIHKVDKIIKDSVTIVIYSNSYKNNQDTLRVIKKDNEWLVDFNYLFDHDSDSLSASPLIKNDSLPK
jgi:hypothetical protein